MRIYVSHSRDFDFHNELYIPIRRSRLNQQHTIILPHENSNTNYSSKEFFRTGCDLLIAEVSFKGIGLGIELGWASSYNVPIIAVHKRETVPSRSISSVTSRFIPYSNTSEMVEEIENEIFNLNR